MRTRTGVIVGICAVVLIGAGGGFGLTRYRRPVPAVAPVIIKPAVSKTTTPVLPWPAYGQSAVGAVGYGVVATSGTQAASPTASVAKVMTALAVLKQKPMKTGEDGPAITITADDVASYQYYAANDGSNVPVELGEQITEREALEAMLLPSANNMAFTLARWAFGSSDAYLAYANNTLAPQLGMTHSHFTDASGFDPGTVASAGDLVALGVQAMADPVIADVVSQSQATVPVAGTVHNVNALLGQSGIVGIKTGNTDAAGGVYLFASKQKTADGQPLVVVGAIMGAPTLFVAMHDSLALNAAVPAGFETRTIVSSGQVVGSYKTPWGSRVTATAQKALTAVVWKDTRTEATVNLHALKAPQTAGTPAGTVTTTVNGTSLTTTAVLQSPLAKPDWLWRLRR